MKKILLLLFAVPFIVFGQEENIIDYNDTIMMDELKIMKSDSSLVNGKVKSWHENGQLKEEATFKDDKKEGIGKTWYETGIAPTGVAPT